MTQRVGAIYTKIDKQVHLQRLIEPAADLDADNIPIISDPTILQVLYNPNNLGPNENIFVFQCRNFATITEKMVFVNQTLSSLGRIV